MKSANFGQLMIRPNISNGTKPNGSFSQNSNHRPRRFLYACQSQCWMSCERWQINGMYLTNRWSRCFCKNELIKNYTAKQLGSRKEKWEISCRFLKSIVVQYANSWMSLPSFEFVYVQKSIMIGIYSCCHTRKNSEPGRIWFAILTVTEELSTAFTRQMAYSLPYK